MGSELVSCRQCSTENKKQDNIYILNEPRFNLLNYKIDNSNFQLAEYRQMELAKINKNYHELIYYLRGHKQKFQDSYFTPNEDALGKKVFKKNQQFSWKRISEVFGAKIPISSKVQANQVSNEINKNILEAMKQIQTHSELCLKIIPNQIVLQDGIFFVYLPLNGQSKNPVEVIIDDYIPVTKTNQYLFATPYHTLWMVVIEKAFAKILGTYQKLKTLSVAEFFQEITGIPKFQNIYFRPSYHLQSASQLIPGQTSQYFKFSINKLTTAFITLWQPRKSLFDFEIQYIDLAAQLAYEIRDGYKRIVYSTQLVNNKLIMCQNQEASKPLELQPGNYFIHLFGRYPSMVSRKINIVIYSSEKIALKNRQAMSMNGLKYKMIEHTYKQNFKKKKLTLVKQQKGTSSRFVWDGHRGILCLKNQYEKIKQFRIVINKEKRHDIYFEDKPQQSQLSQLVSSDKYWFVFFVRRTNQDLGKFYDIFITK